MSLFSRLAEAEAPPTPGQANWDEKKHPRAKGGKFAKKFAPPEPGAAPEPPKSEPAPSPAAAHPAATPPEVPKAAEPPAEPPKGLPKPAEAPPAPAAAEKPKRTPSKYQQAVFDWVKASVAKSKAALIVDALAGSGKCLGLGTPVLMFDGTIKPVQEIRPGERLMGPDGEPRTVLSTASGFGPLFEITPVKGEPWVCNDVHVLTLVNSVTGEVFDVPLDEYLKPTPKTRFHDAKLFRVGVPFEPRRTAIEPYLLGLWLGDGTTGQPQISTPSVEIHDYLKAIAPKYGVTAKVSVYGDGKCPCVHLTGDNHRLASFGTNQIRNEVERCLVNGEKRIPSEYLRNDRRARLDLLAGLLDTDGYYLNGHYEITTKFAGLRDDVLFLARSLGLAAYSAEKIGRIPSTGFEGAYHRIGISGHLDAVPCRVERKKAEPRRQKKDVLRTGFKASYIGKGDYYGFTLDGDGRFLLGDFTVTHNTTTIEDTLKLIPKDQKVVFLAFNKHIAAELERRTAGSDQVLPSTLSAFGWAACRKAYPWEKKDIIEHCHQEGLPLPDFKNYFGGPVLNDKKVPNLVDKVLTNEEDRENYGDTIANLIRLKKQYYSEDEQGKFNGPSAEEIALKHEIELPTDPAAKKKLMDAATEVWKRSIADNKIMDFADMIFVPARKKLPLADKRKGLASYSPDWCMVDETQDLSMTEATFVKRIAPRTICVGDPHQSIYLFKGSDPQSMSKLQATLGAEKLPLSICYRCPKAVIDEAKKIVPSIESAPSAKQGTVETVKHNMIPALAKPGSYVLCRTTAPLVGECLRMIAQGKKATVKGKDIGNSVEKLVEKVTGKGKTKGDMPIVDFYKKLEEFRETEMKRLTAAKKEHLIDGLQDKIETIHALAAGAKTAGDITKRVNDIFSADDSPGVTFCTVHKSKGLEADHVFIMRPDLMPFPKATSPEQVQQEMNLKYVAITRAKDRLTWVEPPPKEEKDESEDDLVAHVLRAYDAADQPEIGVEFPIGDTGYTAMICDGGPNCPDHARPSLLDRVREQMDFPNKYQSVTPSSSRTGAGTSMPPMPGAIPLQTIKVKKAPISLKPGQ